MGRWDGDPRDSTRTSANSLALRRREGREDAVQVPHNNARREDERAQAPTSRAKRRPPRKAMDASPNRPSAGLTDSPPLRRSAASSWLPDPVEVPPLPRSHCKLSKPELPGCGTQASVRLSASVSVGAAGDRAPVSPCRDESPLGSLESVPSGAATFPSRPLAWVSEVMSVFPLGSPCCARSPGEALGEDPGGTGDCKAASSHISTPTAEGR